METFEKIRALLAEQLDVDPAKITMDSDIMSDFEADSLDIVDMVMTLEDEFGIVPAEDGSGLSIDASAEKAPKTTQMLKAWAAKRNELESGEITPEEYADWKAKF